jgi:hypothetical protein
VVIIGYPQVAKPLRKSRDLILALILAIALIDAVLVAVVRVRLIQSQCHDPDRGHPVAVRPLPRLAGRTLRQ